MHHGRDDHAGEYSYNTASRVEAGELEEMLDDLQNLQRKQACGMQICLEERLQNAKSKFHIWRERGVRCVFVLDSSEVAPAATGALSSRTRFRRL